MTRRLSCDNYYCSQRNERMLVLSRKQNQEIIIGDNIKITVVKMKGNTVRLGIEAPREVNVLRGELPRHESSKTEFTNSEDSQAEMTVVFSNHDGDKTASTNREAFQSFQTKNRLTNPNRQTPQPPSTPHHETQSLRFRGTLPTQLQHNRLKAIVDQLTAKSTK